MPISRSDADGAGERRARVDRIETLLRINERGGKPGELEFLTFGLEEAERLTESELGFLHFVDPDGENLELVTWSAKALRYCATETDRHYPLSAAGIWADSVRQQRPVICNDYAAAANKKGLPAGHVAMQRLISVPVVEDGRVHMILGVGNKAEDYSQFDVDSLQLIGNALWRIVYSQRMQRALAASAERFQAIFSNIGEAIFLQEDGEHSTIVEVNEAALQMFGYPRAAYAGLRLADLSADDETHTRDAAIERARAIRHGLQPPRFEWRARRHDGSVFWVEVNLRSVELGGKSYLLAVIEDITERILFKEAVDANMADLVALNLKLEEAHIQLLQSEKMASIGQLAAGVAHEINNPVGYVYSNLGSLEKYVQDFLALLDAYRQAETAMAPAAQAEVQRLREELDLNFLRQDVVALMGETREGVNRVRKIVQDLKDFSRVGAEDEWQWMDVHTGLDSTLNIVWNELKYKATVNKEYGQLPEIYCLPSQLNQVFMNLLVNAGHAIETKGVVTLRTGHEGDEVWIEVADTGCGIPAENLRRIFDPFFTTKPVGKGTGLGLSVSYSIVQKHQGRIEVNSEVGKGTTFRVWLPVQTTHAAALPSA